jgi:hypothetical protein
MTKTSDMSPGRSRNGTTIKRIIKLVDGTHQIFETFSMVRAGFGIRRRTEYEMKVLDQRFSTESVAR